MPKPFFSFFGKKLIKMEFSWDNELIKYQIFKKVPKIEFKCGIWPYFMTKTSKMAKFRISRFWFNPFVPICSITA